MKKKAFACVLNLGCLLLFSTSHFLQAQNTFPYEDKNRKGVLQIKLTPDTIEFLPQSQTVNLPIKIVCLVVENSSQPAVSVSYDKIEVSNLPKKYIQYFDEDKLTFILSASLPPNEEALGNLTFKLKLKKNKLQKEVIFYVPYRILAEKKEEKDSKIEDSTKIEALEVVNKTSGFENGKGIITLELKGGTPPYKVFYAKNTQTTSKTLEGSSPIILKDLSEATYQITIIDYKEQKIPMFELELKNTKNEDKEEKVNPEHNTVQQTKEEKLWESIINLGNRPEQQLRLVKKYIKEYPQGQSVSSARALLLQLESYFKKKDKQKEGEIVDSLQIIAYSVTPSKKGKNDGKITVEIEGGTPPYDYEIIKTGQENTKKSTSEETKHQFINLPAGEYIIIISDETGQRQTSNKTIKEVGKNYENITLEVSNEGNKILVKAKGGKGEIRIDYHKFQSETIYSTKTQSGKTVEILGFKKGDKVEIKVTDNLSEATEVYIIPESNTWQMYTILGGILVVVLFLFWYFRRALTHFLTKLTAKSKLEKPSETPEKLEDTPQSNIKIRVRKPKDL